MAKTETLNQYYRMIRLIMELFAKLKGMSNK